MDIALNLANCFSNLGEHDLALKFIEKASLHYNNKNKNINSPYSKGWTNMFVHLRSGDEDKAFNVGLESLTKLSAEMTRSAAWNDYLGFYHEVSIKAFLAYYYTKNDQIEEGLNLLSDLISTAEEEDLWVTHPDNEEIPSVHLDDAIFMNYFISAAYKNANEIELHKKYFKIAEDQMFELGGRMDSNHRQLFMNKWINKEILAQKNNI